MRHAIERCRELFADPAVTVLPPVNVVEKKDKKKSEETKKKRSRKQGKQAASGETETGAE